VNEEGIGRLEPIVRALRELPDGDSLDVESAQLLAPLEGDGSEADIGSEVALLMSRLKQVNKRFREKGLPEFTRNPSYQNRGVELTGEVHFVDLGEVNPWYVFAVVGVKRPPNGDMGYESMLIPRKGPHGVCVVPVVNGEYVVGVRQYRITADKFTTEFPRGWPRSAVADPKEAAEQKLFGELPGLRAMRLVSLEQANRFRVSDNSGLYRGVDVHYFVADFEGPPATSEMDLKRQLRNHDSGWTQDPFVFRLDEFDDLLDRGRAVEDVHSVNAWMFFLRERSGLRYQA